MAKCKECDGTGEKFVLPKGNPFQMRLPQLAQALVKIRCFHCKGTGRVNQQLTNGEKSMIKLSDQQRKLDASVSEEQAREYVRKERERNANRDKPYPVPRDGFINDYD